MSWSPTKFDISESVWRTRSCCSRVRLWGEEDSFWARARRAATLARFMGGRPGGSLGRPGRRGRLSGRSERKMKVSLMGMRVDK